MENTFKDLDKKTTKGVDEYTASPEQVLEAVELFNNLSLKAKTLHDWRLIGMVNYMHQSKTKEYKEQGTSFADECRKTFKGLNDDQRSNSIYLYDNFNKVFKWWSDTEQTAKNVRTVCTGYRASVKAYNADKKAKDALQGYIDAGLTEDEIKKRIEQDLKISDNKTTSSDVNKALKTLGKRLKDCVDDYISYKDDITLKSEHEEIMNMFLNGLDSATDKLSTLNSGSGDREELAHVREPIQQVG